MPVISFWGNNKIETGQTTSMVALATYMSIMHNMKVLMIDSKFNSDTISDCFWEEDKSELMEEIMSQKTDISTGIEGLAKAVMSNKSSPEIITNYTKIVFRDRLEILLGMKTTNVEEYKRTAVVYTDIANFAKKTYDMVFIDLESGFDENTSAILQASDLIILNTNQKMKNIEKLNELRNSNPEMFSKDKTLINIGRYDMFSKYNTKNLARALGEKKELLCVPYNTKFFEAAVEGKVAEYFIKYNDTSDPTDANSTFSVEVKRSVERIIYKLQEQQYNI